MKKHSGFTLIELVIIIVILGILAAFAIPKYITLDKEARISKVNGLKSAIRSAALMTHAIAKAKGITTEVIVIDSTTGAQATVNTTNYYPLANTDKGIIEALESYDGFNVSGNGNTIFSLNGAPTPTTCSVSYNIDSGAPIILASTAGC